MYSEKSDPQAHELRIASAATATPTLAVGSVTTKVPSSQLGRHLVASFVTGWRGSLSAQQGCARVAVGGWGGARWGWMRLCQRRQGGARDIAGIRETRIATDAVVVDRCGGVGGWGFGL